MSRPSEAVQATIGSVVGAALIVLGAFFDTSRLTPEVVGAITILLSWVAAAVTWYVARQQRSGELGSGTDGTVSS